MTTSITAGPADRLLALRVADARTGTGQATWGQQAIWDAVSVLGPDAPRYNVLLPLALDPGRPLPVLLDELAVLLRLHDSLRTRLVPDDAGALRQHLDAAGSAPVLLRGCRPEELATQTAALQAELLARAFDTARAWPLRIGLVETDGLVRSLIVVLSHTATDGWGVRRLHQDLLDLWQGLGPARIRALRPALQPLDQAAEQQSDRGRRRDAAARRHWRDRLTQGPARLFRPAPGVPVDPDRLLPNARLHSPVLARVVEQVAAGNGVSGSSVLLAAVAMEQARLSGERDALFQVVVNNRFLPVTAQAVGTLAQEGLFHLPDARGEFAEVLGRAHLAALGCYRHAAYDTRLLDRELAELRATGTTLGDLSCVFNDVRITRADASASGAEAASASGAVPAARRLPLAGLREHSRLSWPIEFPQRGPDFSFALDAVLTSEAVDLALTADSALIPRTGMEQLLRGVEDRIVAEALALGHR